MRSLALEEVRFNADGLVPVVAATASGLVLMLAWADREALERTLATGQMHYHSRSRGTLWRKGETSGHGQRMRSLLLDCDGDTVLALVDQEGPACHTGAATCFDEPEGAAKARAGTQGPKAPGGSASSVAGAPTAPRARAPATPAPSGPSAGDWEVLAELLSVVRSRRGASGSYTAKLLADENLRAKKVAEESGEFIRASAKGDRAHEAEEAADLLYHLLVACEGDGVRFEDVLAVLRRRREERP